MTLDIDWEKKKYGIFFEWLDANYKSEGTKNIYRCAGLEFLRAVYPDKFSNSKSYTPEVDEGITHYLKEQRDFLNDLKKMLVHMDGKGLTSTTINSYIAGLKLFMEEHGREISNKDWRAMRRRKLIPKAQAITRDRVLTKEQIRMVTNYLSILHRAITFFLISTGARIGETVRLKMSDVELEADPPKAIFRAKTTKGGMRRTARMSYEARDTIKAWLKIKGNRQKSGGHGAYEKDKVFGIHENGFRDAWNNALHKAGLDQQDPETRRYVFHLHTLRKFGATEWSMRGIPRDVYEGAFMGHQEYLDSAYKRYRPEQIDEIYKKHMDAVTIYSPDELLDEKEKEIEALKEQVKTLSETEPQKSELPTIPREAKSSEVSKVVYDNKEHAKLDAQVTEKKEWICIRDMPRHPNPEMQKARCETCRVRHWDEWKACQELKLEA